MTERYFEARHTCPACGEGERIAPVYRCSFNAPPVREYVQAHFNKEGKVNWEMLRDAQYVLSACPACGLCYQEQAPSGALLREIYDVWLAPDTLPEDFDDEDLRRFFKRAWGAEFNEGYLHPAYSRDAHEIMMMSNMLGIPEAAMRVLDFGSGWGTWVRVARARGCTPFGFELSRKASMFTKRLGITMLAWGEIPDARVDLINADQVFEHISQPLAVLRHLGKALAPGGVIKISVPTTSNVCGILRRLTPARAGRDRNAMFPVEPLVHINCFGRKSLYVMAEKAGLEICRISYRDAYAFLRRGGLDPDSPAQAMKSLTRPFYRRFTPDNICMYLKKKAA